MSTTAMSTPTRPKNDPISTTIAESPPSSSAVFSPLTWLRTVVDLPVCSGFITATRPLAAGFRAHDQATHRAPTADTPSSGALTRGLGGEAQGAALGAAAGPAQF